MYWGTLGGSEIRSASRMTRRFTAIIEREDDGYVALCPELDIASQGQSVTEARSNLAEAIALFMETASAEEKQRRLSGEVYVTQVEIVSA
jgi:predicted RNase H-like HicB family nuclease